MKKKQFEPILPQYEGQAAEPDHEYAISAFKQGNILAVDFYQEEEGIWKAIWRTLISEKEFCNYKFSTKLWDNRKMENIESEYVFLHNQYRVGGMEKYYFFGDARKVIEDYTEIAGGYKYKNISDTLNSMEEEIARESKLTAKDRKFARIQRKMAQAPLLPEDFQDFISEKLYRHCHIMFVTKEMAICSRCGRKTKKLGTMKHNAEGICPHCNREVTYKHTGRMKEHEEKKEVLLIQRQDKEIILRYFNCSLLSEAGKKENLQCTESVRTYHEEQIKWYKKRYIQYVDWHGHEYWEDKMNAYHQVGYGNKCCLYNGNLEDIKELLEDRAHLPIHEMAEQGTELPWKDILRGMDLKVRNFEKLYKAGLKTLAVEYIRSKDSLGTNYTQTELKKFLGVTKPMLRYLQTHNSNRRVLAVLQDAKKNNHGLNDVEIFELAEAGIKVSELKEVSRGSRIIKTFHYLKKAKGYANLRTMYSHYADYMSMAIGMDYDLHNGTVRYPKDLKAAHDKAVMEFYDGERDKRNQEALRKYPLIKAQAAELEEKYGYHDKNYMIIAPRNAADIVEEGRELHHCVGGDIYLNKHNKGTTFIMFLRKKQEPEKRYYTIELDPENNRIVQYYGYNDKKPDKDLVDKVLDKWKKQLKRKEEREKLSIAQ